MKLTIVKADCGSFYHYGLLVDELEMVYHNSKRKGGVVYDTFDEFADGCKVFFSNIEILDPKSALERANSYLDIPYSLFSKNCEHFVRVCAGLEPESPQIQARLIVFGGLAMALKSNNSAIQAVGLAAAISTLFTEEDRSPIPNAIIASGLAVGVGLLLS